MMRFAEAVTVSFLIVGIGLESVRGADGDQLFKLTADDAAAEDFFGGATPHDTDDRTTQGIAILGDLAIVGAPGADTAAGDNAGAVYTFDLTTGQQRGKITAEDAEPGSTFGSAVAFNGSTVVVGAAHNVSGSTSPGEAYVLDLATSTQRLKLSPEDVVGQFDGFGWSVDIAGDLAIVGAPLHPGGAESFGGSAYVFDITTGQQLHKLVPDQPRIADDWFGISVDLSGNTAIVGAWGDRNFAGAAYLFDVTTGAQLHKLISPAADPFDEFGHSVSIHGNLAAVGAPSDENENGEFSGSVELFDVATGQHLRTLFSTDSESEDRFGWSVDLHGNTVVVGATGDRDAGAFSGAAYLFDTATGRQQLKLTAADAAEGDNAGWSVAMDGGRALVAAPFDDDACAGDTDCLSGAAYVFSVPRPQLSAGDANQDLSFDQRDIVLVSQAAKYLTGQPATWGDGDWNGAPGGSPGDPPDGDGRFDQRDIVAALAGGIYLTGPYAAIQPSGQEGDEQTSLVYDARSGELAVEVPDGFRLTSINIDSAAGVFTGDGGQNLGGSFDNDTDGNLFKATFGSSFGSLSFGNVVTAGLSEQFLRNDLTVIGSREGGGELGDVDLVYVPIPEPSTVLLLMVAATILVACRAK